MFYSKTFHTPLTEVYDLPEEFVLMCYFESHYHDMPKENLDVIVKDMLETPDEARIRIMEEEYFEGEELRYLRDAEKEAAEPAMPKVGSTIQDAVAALSKVGSAIDAFAKAKAKGQKEMDLPSADTETENVNISFTDDLDFEEEIRQHDLSLFGIPKKNSK